MSDPNLLTRLRALDSCALSDAIDQLQLPPGVSGLIPRTMRRRIAGKVMTVRLAGGGSVSGAPPRHLCTAAIEAAEPNGVVVVEQRTGIDAAAWGGVLSNAAKKRDLSGAIIDGPARDVDEAVELDFPVFSRAVTCRTARGRIHEAATGAPIQVGGLRVETGDYVLADSSGTVFIKALDLARAVEAAEAIALHDATMVAALRAGQPVSQVMTSSYDHMLHGDKR
jgi:4-hydroxy-4-methyl-2-oxoglutarate aldolase